MKKLLACGICLLFAAAIGAYLLARLVQPPRVSAQSATAEWEQAAGGKMSFEVASVKQNFSPIGPGTAHSNIPFAPPGMRGFTRTGGLYDSTDQPLWAGNKTTPETKTKEKTKRRSARTRLSLTITAGR